MAIKFHLSAIDGTYVLIERRGGYDDTIHAILDNLPEKKWRRETNDLPAGWHVPMNATTIKFLNEYFQPDVDYTCDAGAKTLIEYENLTNTVNTIKGRHRWQYLMENKTSEFAVVTKRTPFDHQRVTVESMIGSECFGLLMEMGTGKTKCIIDEINYYESMRGDSTVFVTVIVCPKALLKNWEREVTANLCDAFDRKITILNKGLVNSTPQIVELYRDKSPLKILIVGYDSLDTLVDSIIFIKPDMVVFDESHYCKNSETKRWKACKKLADVARIKRIMTGTPSPNNILDIWAQFELLRSGCLGYNTYTAFKHQFAKVESNGQFEKITGFRNVDKLKEAMSRVSFIVRKEQCLSLPEKIYQTVEVEMPDSVRAQYEQFAQNFAILLDDGTSVSTEFILVQMLKLSQICSGFIVGVKIDELDPEKFNKSTVFLENGDAKMDEMLEDVLNTIETNKCVIWSKFKLDNFVIKAKLEAMGVKCGVYDSSTGDKERQSIVDRFTNDDDFRVFIGNPAAGGVGLTLLGTDNVRTSTVYYYNNTFNYGQRVQSEDRCHRIGLRNNIVYKDYVYKNSIEQYITQKLLQKKGLDDAVKNMTEIKDFLLGTRAA